MATWTDIMAEYECLHDVTELRQMRDSMDRTHIVRQCVTCGAHRGSVSKAGYSGAEMDALPLYDRDLQDQRSRETRVLARQRWDAEAYLRRVDYDTYLQSPAWQHKRALVLARDKYLCQGCLEQRATEVHHRTYEHRGQEFCWELLAVCRACHERLSLDEQKESAS